MTNPVRLIVISVSALLIFQYLKKRKAKKNTEIQKISETVSVSELDQIRLNLLEYIETRNIAEGKNIPRERLDHDIMYITTVKK